MYRIHALFLAGCILLFSLPVQAALAAENNWTVSDGLAAAVASAAAPAELSIRPGGSGQVEALPCPLHGITVDDSWYGARKQAQIIAAIKAMPVKPIVRIVMDKTHPARHYLDLFKDIHSVAYVMACPVDSTYMKAYTTKRGYIDRFDDAFHVLGPYVDLWEIGNEINGEDWLGDDKQFVADKAYAAYKFIRSKGGRTSLTAYLFRPDAQSMSMGHWLRQYIPDDMKAGLDYLMVSYYEDDNGGYQPRWPAVFKEMQGLFPAARLAAGECGNIAPDATEQSKIEMVRRYYTMDNPVKNFAGGYFWWNWVQDCTPHRNSAVWTEINRCMLKQPPFEGLNQ